MLLEGDAHIYDYLDRKVTRGLVAEHLDGVENRRLFIWSLLSVENWFAGHHA
jgi:asparagine synthase (glutamine-hydrolysing)